MSEIQTLPVLPLRDIVVFPHMVVPLFVGRPASVAAINSSAKGDKRVFAVANEGEGRPDGAAVDSEGCYWSARYDGWRIVRHAPDGRELFVLRTPVQNPTMCTFAGDDLSTLVFTSARGSLTAAELERQPWAGSVFAVDVGVRGCREPQFRQ